MSRQQEVREFELITGSEAYRDQNVPGIRYCEFFDSLKNFVLEYSTRNDDSDILEFMKPGFKRNIGEYISIRNYVGVVQLRNGCQLQILPKIDFTRLSLQKIFECRTRRRQTQSVRNFHPDVCRRNSGAG